MKTILKGIVLLLFVSFAMLLGPSVKAWFRAYPVTTIHIENVEEPYYLDLLIPLPEAPLLSEEDLAARLSAEYLATPYVESMNGYRDEDGYASIRLYPPSGSYTGQYASPSFQFVLENRTPTTYKIILVFEDGSTHISPLITQRKNVADITYDLVSIGMQESDYDPAIISIPLAEGDGPLIATATLFAVLCIVIVITVVELALLFLMGYRKKTSFGIVGVTHLSVLGVGFGFFVLNEVFPAIPFALIAIPVFAGWVIAESILLPKWIGERKMEKTMAYVFSSNLISMLSLVLIYLIHFYENR